jgi:hypothetical protein
VLDAARLARQRDHRPGPPSIAADAGDHGDAPADAREAPVVALERDAVRAPRIAERDVGAGATKEL